MLTTFQQMQAAKIMSSYNTIQKSQEELDLMKGGTGSGRHKVGDDVKVASHGHEFNKRTGKIISSDNGQHTVEFLSKDGPGDNTTSLKPRTATFSEKELIAKSDDMEGTEDDFEGIEESVNKSGDDVSGAFGGESASGAEEVNE